MLQYLVRRVMWAVVLFVAATIVTYIIFYAIPANPARLACGQRATAECVKRAEHYLGTDRPLYFQYYKFFGRLIDQTGSYDAGIALAGCLPLVAAAVWWLLWDRTAPPRQ